MVRDSLFIYGIEMAENPGVVCFMNKDPRMLARECGSLRALNFNLGLIPRQFEEKRRAIGDCMEAIRRRQLTLENFHPFMFISVAR